MSAQELEFINQLLRAAPKGIATDDWVRQRESMEARLAEFPLPSAIERKEVKANGVPAEWSYAAHAAKDTALLYLHGGGYCIGSVKTHRPLTSEIAKSFAGRVLSVDYRLGPEHMFPAAIDDAVDAYRFLVDSGIKPPRIAVAGDSAGGGLALATLVAIRDRGLPVPAAGWGLSPWTDLEGRGSSLTTKTASDLIVEPDKLHIYAKAYAGNRRGEPLASPLNADLKGLPPLLLHVGSAEVLLDDSVRFAARAGAADVECRLEIWPHMPHVWHIFSPMLSEAREAVAAATSWLNGKIDAPK